jgi:hypothetical protein
VSLSPTDAWGVGSFKTSDITAGNLQHWDGTSWSVSPDPPQSQNEILEAITAVSANDIWVGGCLPAFFEHYDGSQWTFVSSGTPLSGESCIYGVSGDASNDVWAVGQQGVYTLIEHWDGSQWQIVPSPNAGKGTDQLNGVAALASNDVWAVGFSTPSASQEMPTYSLIEHWDGSTWTVVPSPNVDYDGKIRNNILQGVVALSPNDVWAYGYFEANPSGESGDLFALVLHWDGTSWTVAPSPQPDANPPLINNELFGGVVTGPGTIWLVGQQTRKSPPVGAGTLVLYTAGG